MTIKTGIDSFKLSIGKEILQAGSSLDNFVLALIDGTALVIEAIYDGEPKIVLSTSRADSLPRLKDAVCGVDWSWIYGSTIKQAYLKNGRLNFELDPAGRLTVIAGIWQNSPFLGFQPHRPAK